MLKFTPPASGSTRLSQDVWQLICHHATANGNSSPREAIEQLIRRTLGTAQPIATEPTQQPAQQKEQPPREQPSAAAALDALLSD